MTLLLPLTLLRRAPTTPPPTHAAAARTALAPHQRRIRDHEPVRPSTARAGPTLPPAACTGQLAPLHACLAATRTALELHRQCNRDLGPDQLTLSMHRVLTLTRIRLTSLPARPCRASHDPGRPSWPYHDLILTRPYPTGPDLTRSVPRHAGLTGTRPRPPPTGPACSNPYRARAL